MAKKKSSKLKYIQMINSRNSLFSFLKRIKREINSKKKYSLFCNTLLAFSEKGKIVLNETDLFNYIIKSVFQNENNNNDSENIDIKNYTAQIHQLLSTNKCFIKFYNKKLKGEQIKLNKEYINSHKQTIYKLIFGKKLSFNRSSPEISEKKADKMMNNDESNGIFFVNNNKLILNDNKEIIMNKNVDSFFNDNIHYIQDNNKKINAKKNLLMNSLFFEDNKNKNKIIHDKEDQNTFKDKLGKKLFNIIQKAESFLSLINIQNSSEIINDNNYDQDYYHIILLKYKDDPTLKNCLNIAKNDYITYTKYMKYFINKNIGKRIGDDIKNILVKKKNECSLVICRIVTKLSQFLLDYNFIMEIIYTNKSKLKTNEQYSILIDGIIKFSIECMCVLNQDNVYELEKKMETKLNNVCKFI